jgi:gamma-glutamylcyclotransferase (GGCT)/AIG2-like uncharacterized protein YtfP
MEYIFVYGLFRDSGNNLLKDQQYCGKSYIKGRLYRVNEFYPGYVPDPNGKVWGDVYLIDPVLFPILDEYEGTEYIRKQVKTANDLLCWVYEYKYSVEEKKEIISGDWMLR